MPKKRAYEDVFIDAAIHVVYEGGIENLRTKDVADLTGFSEATLFRFFQTKEILLRSTFLYVDKRISDILSQSAYVLHSDDTPHELVLYGIWHKVYRHLIENQEETICLIRYRYSSLYSPEVRKMREAYNGGLDRAYEVFERKMGELNGTSWQLLLNNMFEVTLCFAEKIITGRLEDTEETEGSIWTIIMNSIENAKRIGG